MKPNIIWVTIDSIRADHCSVNGYSRDTTPVLESVAAKSNSANFENCFSHGIWSLESAASILSGTYPSYHRTGSEDQALPQDLYTIPERFADIGYQTAAVSANPWFAEEFGLGQGFETFTKANKRNITNAGYLNTLKYLFQINSEGGGYTKRKNVHKSEYISRKVITNLIEAMDDCEPHFLYAHTEGVHTPYYPPGRTLGTFSDDLHVDAQTARELSYNINENLYQHVANGLYLSESDLQVLKTMYDELLRYADRQIQYIVDAIRDLDRPTVLIVTSDHGDMLGEQNLLYHMLSVHDGLTHVPCVILGLNHLNINSDITNGITQHIDIMKTILGAVDGPTKNMHGYDLRKSRRDHAITQRSKASYETSLEKLTDETSSLPHVFDQFPSGFTTAIRTASHKFITDGEIELLYSLPNETKDVKQDNPEVLSNLQEAYAKVRDKHFRDESTAREGVDIAPSVEDRLSQLGYR